MYYCVLFPGIPDLPGQHYFLYFIEFDGLSSAAGRRPAQEEVGDTAGRRGNGVTLS